MQISISNLFLAAFLIAISDDAIQIPPAFVAQTHTHTHKHIFVKNSRKEKITRNLKQPPAKTYKKTTR